MAAQLSQCPEKQCPENSPALAVTAHVPLIAPQSRALETAIDHRVSIAPKVRIGGLDPCGKPGAPSTGAFSFREARRILGDLFIHRPVIYWADMLLTLAVGYGFAYVYL